jgi:hypothetical protein
MEFGGFSAAKMSNFIIFWSGTIAITAVYAISFANIVWKKVWCLGGRERLHFLAASLFGNK